MVNLKAFTVPLFFIVGLLTILVPRTSLAETIHTGSGRTHKTIQSAANAAQPGDTVLVDNGKVDYDDIVVLYNLVMNW